MMRKKGKWSIEKHSVVGWEDLHEDILGMVFERLDRKCLFQSVYPVCQWWRAVSRPMLFRKTDMLDFKGLTIKDVDHVDHFMKMLKLILDGLHRKSVPIFRFIFPQYLYLSDEHLWYLAQRLPKLQGVHLPCTTNMITPLGFSRAIQIWSELRTFCFGSINFSDYTYIIKEISVNCKNLRTLCIDINDVGTNKSSVFVLNEETSLLITNSLPNLQGIGLGKCVLYKSGLKNIMKKCEHLKYVLMVECKHPRRLVDSSVEGKGCYLITKSNENHTVKWLIVIEEDNVEACLSTSSMVNFLWRYQGTSKFRFGVFD